MNMKQTYFHCEKERVTSLLKRQLLVVCIWLLVLPTQAAMATDPLMVSCEQSWPATKNASVEMTQDCASYWLRYGYGEAWSKEDLDFDDFNLDEDSSKKSYKMIEQKVVPKKKEND